MVLLSIFLLCISLQLSTTLTNITAVENRELLEICGNRPIYDTKRYKIYHGRTSKPGQFPWAVDITQSIPEMGFVHTCGGAMITRKHVLTAAHCVNQNTCNGEVKPSNYVVRLGSIEVMKGYPIEIRALVDHPQWGTGHGNGKCFVGGDVAILELSTPIPERLIRKGVVGFVCLPEPDLEFGVREMTTHGWGTTVSERTAKSLMWTKLVPMSHKECARRKKKNVPEDTLCTFETTTNVCGGDSGGPLLLKNLDKHYSVAGTVSFGTTCKKMEEQQARDEVENTGGFFTDIRKHLKWICAQTGACYTSARLSF